MECEREYGGINSTCKFDSIPRAGSSKGGNCLRGAALCGKIAETVGFGGAFSFGYFSLGEQRKVTSQKGKTKLNLREVLHSDKWRVKTPRHG
jgi:hypothetical protein